MINPRLLLICAVGCLLAAGRTSAQPVYYNISNPSTNQNTVDEVAATGGGSAVLLRATGVGGNQLNHCTAVAVDGLNGALFLVDGAAVALWRTNLDGSGLMQVKGGLTSYPTDLALDVLNEQIYFTTSSTLQSSNTVQRIDYTGANNTVLFTATGGGGNGVARCTAIAVDVPHDRIFLADAGAQKIWSLNLTGGGLVALATTTNSYPTDVALDETNQWVYFTASSTTTSSNTIQRVGYDGAGLTTVYTAAGGVQRCTALAVDAAHSTLYLSDAGVNTPALWRIPLGGAATSLVSGLEAPAKKVRWFSGPATRPPPGFAGLDVSPGTAVVLHATNGYVGGTYFLLTSTNLALPLDQWLPLSTNVLGATGDFTLTASNGLAANPANQYFLLRVQ